MQHKRMGFLRYSCLIFGVVFFNSFFANSQNLIKNPSFESYKRCPTKLGNLQTDVTNWESPTLGSTDYFNGCSQAMGTPKNFNGEQPADFGVGYVGFYLFAPEDYREYLQAELTQTLTKGERYTVSFYISLAERSDFAIQEFGLQFSELPVHVDTRKVLSKMHLSRHGGNTSNYQEIRYTDFYSDKKDWVFIEKEFVANGTENFLIIGNFKNNKATKSMQTKRKVTQGSYYYLDMVSVKKASGAIVVEDTVTYRDYTLNKTHIFKDVLFSFNTALLAETYQTELEQISDYMLNNPHLKIRISGHTDSIGSISFNKNLSLKRAKSVSRYLMDKGINADRIFLEGHGSKNAVATNKTKAGRLLNRRVEFFFFE